jgi:hypothetical protein
MELAATQTRAKAETDKAQLETFHAKVQHETTLQLAKEKATMDNEAMMLDAEIKRRADARAHELHSLQLEHEKQAHAHKLQQADQQHAQTLETASHGAALKERETGKVAEKEIHSDNHAKLEKMFGELSKALTAPKKIVRDGKGDIVGVEPAKSTKG